MKTKVLSLLTAIILLSTFANAQIATMGYAFQGYAIDLDGKALGNENIKVKFTITPNGYTEEQDLTSDVFGVFTATVGSVTPATFGNIDYRTVQSLKVEVKKIGGTYTTIHTGQMKAVPYSQYAQTASNGVPVGTIIAFAGSGTTIPVGWLECNGATLNLVSNPEYTDLANVINPAQLGPNNVLPDLRNDFLRGATHVGNARGVGTTQAQEIGTHGHTATSNSAGSHNHTYGDIYYSEAGGTIGVPSRRGSGDSDSDNYGYQITRTTQPSGSHSHAITVANHTGGENRPANTAVLYIIKY